MWPNTASLRPWTISGMAVGTKNHYGILAGLSEVAMLNILGKCPHRMLGNNVKIPRTDLSNESALDSRS